MSRVVERTHVSKEEIGQFKAVGEHLLKEREA